VTLFPRKYTGYVKINFVVMAFESYHFADMTKIKYNAASTNYNRHHMKTSGWAKAAVKADIGLINEP